MNQKKFSTEAAYLAGLVILALGTAFMERADFGMSMVVAPAYLLHLAISPYLPFFTFGMAEYTFQALLLAAMCLILGRFRASYLFSFVTAVLYGFTLDGAIWLVAFVPDFGTAGRVVFYVLGVLFGSLGVALLFHTYIAPEVYELFVKEASDKWARDIHRVKTVYDCLSCLAAVIMSFAFFGLWHFEGVKLGTVICALCNGTVIGFFDRWLEKKFAFADAFRLRKLFE